VSRLLLSSLSQSLRFLRLCESPGLVHGRPEIRRQRRDALLERGVRFPRGDVRPEACCNLLGFQPLRESGFQSLDRYVGPLDSFPGASCRLDELQAPQLHLETWQIVHAIEGTVAIRLDDADDSMAKLAPLSCISPVQDDSLLREQAPKLDDRIEKSELADRLPGFMTPFER